MKVSYNLTIAKITKATGETFPMEIISLFKDFGYPALISGILLWILATKIEKISIYMEQIKAILLDIQKEVDKNQSQIEVNQKLLYRIETLFSDDIKGRSRNVRRTTRS